MIDITIQERTMIIIQGCCNDYRGLLFFSFFEVIQEPTFILPTAVSSIMGAGDEHSSLTCRFKYLNFNSHLQGDGTDGKKIKIINIGLYKIKIKDIDD